ncbi:hypothetical protein LCGC14_1054610 [marine sediment metagenome]|uniref:Uncharacterized protein n=1 Tax=marine sediment metagenome TaxID=412755 RepID=A0A0F9MSC8_9ZZZZ
MNWISQEAAAKALFNLYNKIGLNITYDQILQKLQEKCESGEIPIIYIPYHMKDKAHLN